MRAQTGTQRGTLRRLEGVLAVTPTPPETRMRPRSSRTWPASSDQRRQTAFSVSRLAATDFRRPTTLPPNSPTRQTDLNDVRCRSRRDGPAQVASCNVRVALLMVRVGLLMLVGGPTL